MIRAAIVVLLLSCGAALADEATFVVIVNAKNSITKIDKKMAADAFLKKRTRWGDDKAIQPVDQNRASKTRKQFSSNVLERTVEAVRTYWNQLVFSGRGVPPPEVETDEDVVKYVASHPGAIGYVISTADVKSVKVIRVE